MLRCAAFFTRFLAMTQSTRRDGTEESSRKNWLLIHPNGVFKNLWNVVILIFVGFTLLWMPFQLAFLPEDLEEN